MFNTLGDVCLFVRNGFPYKPSENGLPVTRIETISSGVINFAKVGFAEPDSKINQFKMEPGDILFSNINSPSHLGKVAFYDEVDELYHGMNLLCLRINKDIAEPKYIYYLLDSSFGKRMSAIYGKVAINQSSISSSDVKAYKLKLPPLEKQREIAATLSTWDRAIELHDKLIALKEKQKQGLMQVLLTGKKRLLDDNGVPFSGEWDWLKANHLFKPVSKKNNCDTEELLSVTQDQGVVPRSHLERRVTMPDGSTKGYKLVMPGSFIISLRSFQGGLEYSPYRGLVSPAYTVLEPIRPIDDGFYKQYYKSHNFIGHLAVAVIGIRDGRQISYEDFSFIKLPFPPINEQIKIAKVLSAADYELNALKSKRDLLNQQKQGLMQQLLG